MTKFWEIKIYINLQSFLLRSAVEALDASEAINDDLDALRRPPPRFRKVLNIFKKLCF